MLIKRFSQAYAHVIQARLPTATVILFYTQIFATLGYAVLSSTLVLMMTSELSLPATQANTLMGGFLAFNYSLHFLGGYLGGRLLSNRMLFVYGMCLQIVSYFLLIESDLTLFLWGLAFFLCGAGINVTCINMMLTQLFSAHDPKRESAFLWNYSGMNIGFFIGYTVAGYFQLNQDYTHLMLVAGISNFVAILIAVAAWPVLKDKVPIAPARTWYLALWRVVRAVVVLLAFIPFLYWLLQHVSISNQIITVLTLIMAVAIVINAFREQTKSGRNRHFAFLILAFASLVFWSMYQMAR